METVELTGHRVAQLWLGGADTGPVVLFFHGCPDTRWAARSGEEAAREAGVRLLCVNRPGYGASGPAASSHASVADDAAEVLDRLGIAEVAALGMSVGGAYAAAFAARHAQRTARARRRRTRCRCAATDDHRDQSSEAIECRPPRVRGVGRVDGRQRPRRRRGRRPVDRLPAAA